MRQERRGRAAPRRLLPTWTRSTQNAAPPWPPAPLQGQPHAIALVWGRVPGPRCLDPGHLPITPQARQLRGRSCPAGQSGATSATSAGPKPTCTEGPYGPVAYFLAQHKWRPWPRAGGSHSRGLSVPGGCGRGRAGLLWTPGGKQGTPLSPVLKAVLSTLGLAHSLTSALNLHGHDHPD